MEFDERRYRPLSTVDLFDEAFDLYKRNFVLFLSIVAVIVVPSTFAMDIYTLKWTNAITGQLSTMSSTMFDPTVMINDLVALITQLGYTIALSIPVWSLEFVILTAAISARYLGRPITILQACIEGIRRYIPALIAVFLYTVFSLLGVLFMLMTAVDPGLIGLFVLGGLIIEIVLLFMMGARFPLFMGALVDEKLGPINALNRSSSLTKGDTGRVVWALLCLSVLSFTMSTALEGVLELFTGGIVNSEYLVIPALQQNKLIAGQVASGLANLILTPYGIIVVTLLYYDQRIRKEGFDMEVLAGRLGYRPINVPQAAYAPALSSAKAKLKK